MKQTAVEWLIEELNQKIHIIPMDKWDKIRDLVQKAKAMEKEQIINFTNNYLDDYEDTTVEQYYNETYKQD